MVQTGGYSTELTILPRSKSKKHSVRLSVTLDQGEYAELTRLGAELDLSAAWMNGAPSRNSWRGIARASRRTCRCAGPEPELRGGKKAGESHGP